MYHVMPPDILIHIIGYKNQHMFLQGKRLYMFYLYFSQRVTENQDTPKHITQLNCLQNMELGIALHKHYQPDTQNSFVDNIEHNIL